MNLETKNYQYIEIDHDVRTFEKRLPTLEEVLQVTKYLLLIKPTSKYKMYEVSSILMYYTSWYL